MDQRTESQRVGDRLDAEHGTDDPFAAAIRGTRMSIVVTDARQQDEPIVFANDAFLKLTGYVRDEVLGRNCRFLQGPGTDPAQIAKIREALAAGRDVNVEMLNYHKDGTPFWNALYLSPVRDDSGEVVYHFGSQFDVTEKKRFEFELKEAHDGLERAVRERTHDLQSALDQKTVLLHEVDHRVKNNLQLISSLVQLQLRRSQEPAVREALSAVMERVGAVSTVHRRLFQSDDVARFDLADFIVDLTDDLGPIAAERNLRIDLSLEPVSVASGKAAPVALIVNELLQNALGRTFTDGGEGRIHVIVERRGDSYRIAVEDGGGEAERSRLEKAGGRYIVDLLARQLRATVDWHAGEGTRVEITLPVDGMVPA